MYFYFIITNEVNKFYKLLKTNKIIKDIADSKFEENHSRYISNCLTFSGQTLKIFNSTFSNNTSIWDHQIMLLFLSGSSGVPGNSASSSFNQSKIIWNSAKNFAGVLSVSAESDVYME